MHQLQQFVAQVFLGIHGVEFAGKTVSDFSTGVIQAVENDAGEEIIYVNKPALKRFKFTELAIALGTELRFKADASLTCTVLNDTQVKFNDQTLSLSRAAIAAFAETGIARKAARGPDYWLHNGQSLTALRLKKLANQMQ